jgi:F0F1-type ATP synthase assembly protein I
VEASVSKPQLSPKERAFGETNNLKKIMSSQSNKGRADIALILSIVLGLGLGFLIKKVSIGLLIGLAIGLMASVFAKRR